MSRESGLEKVTRNSDMVANEKTTLDDMFLFLSRKEIDSLST